MSKSAWVALTIIAVLVLAVVMYPGKQPGPDIHVSIYKQGWVQSISVILYPAGSFYRTSCELTWDHTCSSCSGADPGIYEHVLGLTTDIDNHSEHKDRLMLHGDIVVYISHRDKLTLWQESVIAADHYWNALVQFVEDDTNFVPCESSRMDFYRANQAWQYQWPNGFPVPQE